MNREDRQVHAGPICVESGAYIVQPAAGAPPGTKNEPISSALDTGSSQKLELFIRANHQRHHAADHQIDDREQQIQRADVLVIRREQPAASAGRYGMRDGIEVRRVGRRFAHCVLASFS
ncbi:hypothetical protein WT08_19900 [Burkholderia sp. MSMB1552]|nr:hypothetical protein WT08_19900 [Burkholderia sp. MSMB1552]KWZ50032.1 hypothetical protein WS92_21485 [Burkholderia sp. MSMB1588]